MLWISLCVLGGFNVWASVFGDIELQVWRPEWSHSDVKGVVLPCLKEVEVSPVPSVCFLQDCWHWSVSAIEAKDEARSEQRDLCWDAMQSGLNLYDALEYVRYVCQMRCDPEVKDEALQDFCKRFLAYLEKAQKESIWLAGSVKNCNAENVDAIVSLVYQKSSNKTQQMYQFFMCCLPSGKKSAHIHQRVCSLDESIYKRLAQGRFVVDTLWAMRSKDAVWTTLLERYLHYLQDTWTHSQWLKLLFQIDVRHSQSPTDSLKYRLWNPIWQAAQTEKQACKEDIIVFLKHYITEQDLDKEARKEGVFHVCAYIKQLDFNAYALRFIESGCLDREMHPGLELAVQSLQDGVAKSPIRSFLSFWGRPRKGDGFQKLWSEHYDKSE